MPGSGEPALEVVRRGDPSVKAALGLAGSWCASRTWTCVRISSGRRRATGDDDPGEGGRG